MFSKSLNFLNFYFYFYVTSRLPAVLQWDTAKQADRGADDTNTLKFLSPLPVDFLLPNNPRTPLAVSLSVTLESGRHAPVAPL